MGRAYRTYTDKFKASAVLMVEAAGYPHTYGAIERVSREQGIAPQTLKNWVVNGIRYGDKETAAEVEELMEETRSELKDLLDNAIRAALAGMKIKIEDASYKDLSLTVAIFTDKLQLLNDKPTQNVQQAISFRREGISTIPQHLTSGTIEGVAGEEEIQRIGLWAPVGEHGSGH